MKNNKLRLITSKTLVPGIVSVTDNKTQSNIIYIDEEENVVTITEGESKYRPIHCSELYNKLKSRDWNITERKYITKVSTKNGEEFNALKLKITPTNSEIDRINTTDPKTGIFVCSVNEPSDSEIESFRTNDIYREILNTMDVNEIYLYNSSKGFMDLLNGSMSLDIIKSNSDIYTNSINLNDSFIITMNGTSIKVDLSIKYSKDNKVFGKDITFKGAEYKNDKLIKKNLISDINNDIRLEYINGVARLFPINNSIDEYIISSCTITYGDIR